MAAIMDPYQPEGLNFSSRYSADVRDSYSEEERPFDPEDEVVRSKPRGKLNSYAPLVNESPHRKEWLERQGQLDEETAKHSVHQDQTSPGVSPPSTYTPSQGSGISSKLPTMILTTSGAVNTNDHSGPVLKEEPIKVDLSVPSLARDRLKKSATPESETDQEQDGELGGSTTALLGEYQEGGVSRQSSSNSRANCVPLGLPGDVLCSSGGLVEVLVVNHKKCSVSLDEDCISWQILSRKSGE